MRSTPSLPSATGWLARTLHAHGAVFFAGVFDDRHDMAAAVNRLLVVGFYMLNLGYAFMLFRTNDAATAVEAAETLITKLGVLLLSLGVIHFVNLAVFWKIRNRGLTNDMLPLPYTATVVTPPASV